MAHQSSEVGRDNQTSATAGAVTLLLTARIRPEKRAEFLLSARSLGPNGVFAFFEEVDDPMHVCAVARLEADATGPPYLGSERFRALRGALRTLASGWTISVLQESQTWCAESKREG